METVDLIETIVSSMTPTITIDNIVDNGDGTQTIYTCNTQWIRPFLTVTINSVDYVVSDIDYNVSFTIPTTPLVTVASFTLQAPYYYHGTPIQVNNEWVIKNLDSEKYPLVYLIEPMSEFFYDEEVAEDKDSPLRLLFLDSLSSNTYEVTQHYDSSIKPLVSSCLYFVELLKNNTYTNPFSYTKTNRVKVGVESTNKGSTSQIINDPLNAVEFVGTVTWLKSTNCLC